MDPEKRLEAFEKMLAEIQKDYETAENNRKKFIVLIIILGIVLFFQYENHHLVVSCYTYQNDIITAEMDGYRIVQISDLHNAKFGQNNEKLIRKIASLEPDMIVVTGDLVDSNHTDLVLCGHAHGGQFILPFLGAVVAPDQGLFPKYTEGEYRMGNTTMHVSRGLGNSVIPIRLFNDPEIVCVELRG